tara:strand:- start:640 stop:741 length:102 start_codon:yes stop_codon:yes gene_type:complete
MVPFSRAWEEKHSDVRAAAISRGLRQCPWLDAI